MCILDQRFCLVKYRNLTIIDGKKVETTTLYNYLIGKEQNRKVAIMKQE